MPFDGAGSSAAQHTGAWLTGATSCTSVCAGVRTMTAALCGLTCAAETAMPGSCIDVRRMGTPAEGGKLPGQPLAGGNSTDAPGVLGERNPGVEQDCGRIVEAVVLLLGDVLRRLGELGVAFIGAKTYGELWRNTFP